ncbi:MAG: CoA transferase [Pseudomonadales bacterium]
MNKPLAGLRVLSMEQAAALPFASRHLADLGAEVIRVQSHRRGAGVLLDPSLFRNKRMVGLDLGKPGGPEAFRKLARACDVVAHNYTPRVMRKYAIDFDAIAAIHPRVIYCSITGFGTTGPWCDRPLFGPGAEALSGQNFLIGDPDTSIPGRPGTITYADNVCGLNLLLAILAALERRDRISRPQHLDVSLYETGVANLGAVIAERSLGAPLPSRIGNEDECHGYQAVVQAKGHDRYVAISARDDQLDALLAALGASRTSELAGQCASMSAERIAEALQSADIAAAVVADASDVMNSARLQARGYFGNYPTGNDAPQFALPWGNATELELVWPKSIGADNEGVFRDIAGLSEEDIEALERADVLGTRNVQYTIRPAADPEVKIDRGELSRVDKAPRSLERDRKHQIESRALGGTAATKPHYRVLELAAGTGVAFAAKLLADLGWEVVRAEPAEGDPLRELESRWGAGQGGAFAYVNARKKSVIAPPARIAELAQASDVVIGDFRSSALCTLGLDDGSFEHLSPRFLNVSLTPVGLRGPESRHCHSDLTLQAASGFLFLTGEYDQVPQQLTPYSAEQVGGLAAAGAIYAALIECLADGRTRRLDLALTDGLTACVHHQGSRYANTGEVARREGRVKQAIRMAPASDGYIYCAPGAVASVSMEGVAELLDEPRLAEARFQTAEGRMTHWNEYVELMTRRFRTRSRKSWFEAAASLHLTFALVQTVDELLACPQLRSRGFLETLGDHPGGTVVMPASVMQAEATREQPLRYVEPGADTQDVMNRWLAESPSPPGESK